MSKKGWRRKIRRTRKIMRINNEQYQDWKKRKSDNDANNTSDLLQRLALDWPSPQLQATWHYVHLATHHADADYVASADAAVVIAAARTGHGAT